MRWGAINNLLLYIKMHKNLSSFMCDGGVLVLSFIMTFDNLCISISSETSKISSSKIKDVHEQLT